MQKFETVIVGGGISGLACGRTLHDAGKSFILISPELGGRMRTSKSHTVDYGASYMTTEYTNVMRFADKGDRLGFDNCFFIDKGKVLSFFSPQVLLHAPRLMKLLLILADTRRRVRRFRRRTLHMSQVKALAMDKVLYQYARMPAKEFVKQQGFQYFNDKFLNPLVNSTVFVEYDRINTLLYLGCLMNIICRTYTVDFQHTVPRLTAGWHKNIRLQTVRSVVKKGKAYLVRTDEDSFTAKNVVLALPHRVARKIHHVPCTGYDVPIYVHHVVGTREEAYYGRKVIFFPASHHDVTILWKQSSGSDLIFSKKPDPELEKYYESHHIIHTTYWNPSLIVANKWTEQDLGDGLYLASDYNFPGLEEAFITGVYAANQIIKK